MKLQNIADIYPLSPMQQGLLFHSLYDPASSAFSNQVGLCIEGQLDRNAFRRAWQKLLEQHEVLRASILWEGVSEPVQIIHVKFEFPWQEEDWRGLADEEQEAKWLKHLEADQSRHFDLTQSPLLRLALFRLGDERFYFLWSNHHILFDGWCRQLLLREVFEIYEGFAKGREVTIAKPRPYRDFIGWLQKQDEEKAQKFWREELRGFVEPLQLEILKEENERAGDPHPEYQHCKKRLGVDLTQALQAFLKEERITLNTVMQGLWALLLSRYTGQTDVVFGATVSGRAAGIAGIETMIGLFINTLPVRVRIAQEQSTGYYLRELQANQSRAREYEHTSFLKIQSWSEVQKELPLFNTLLLCENFPIDDHLRAGKTGGLHLKFLHGISRDNYPLTFLIFPGNDLLLQIQYKPKSFEKGSIERLMSHLENLLAEIVAKPHAPLAELEMLSEEEREEVVRGWNGRGDEYEGGKSVAEEFVEQAERTPEAVALVYEEQHLSYAELNHRASRLGGYLRKLGVKAEERVGICLERGIEMMVGLFGILKAGGAYVPLDPGFPAERLRYMVKDSQPVALLTQKHLQELFAGLDQKLPVVELEEAILALEEENIKHDGQQKKSKNRRRGREERKRLAGLSTADQLAYVIYTSGSTGTPKGVMVSHCNVMNILNSVGADLGLGAEDQWLTVTTLSFDIAALELYLPLIRGAKVILVKRETTMNGEQLKEVLEEKGVTVMQGTPHTWQLLLEAGWKGLKEGELKILCGGEALPVSLAEELRTRGKVWNMYGPTETTIWSAMDEVSREGNISIGRPIANTQIYILDSRLEPGPVGVKGEIYIGGEGVARGYWNRPELTSERFIADPFQKTAEGKRLYKTGDVGRWLKDGRIEYLGRMDEQVKVRGYRIELGEIEARLREYAQIREVAVMVRQQDKRGETDKQLVAYCVKKEGHEVSTGELREHLQKSLPNYMVPGVYVFLEEMPLTANGKVDRRKLVQVKEQPACAETMGEVPGTGMEELLLGMWEEVLERSGIGVRANFFELGGHSLQAMRVMARLRESLHIEVPLRDIFNYPILKDFVRNVQSLLHKKGTQHAVPVQAVSRSGALSLSFNQEGHLFREWWKGLHGGSSTALNLSIGLQLTGELNVDALEEALNSFIQRHEIFRTFFPERNRTDSMELMREFQEAVHLGSDNERIDAFLRIGPKFFKQEIRSTLNLKLQKKNLEQLQGAALQKEVKRISAAIIEEPFFFGRPPLMRVGLLRLNALEHVLLFVVHHMIADRWSLAILVRELPLLYQRCIGMAAPELPELPVQYIDFAQWQRARFQSHVLMEMVEYWKDRWQKFPLLEAKELPFAKTEAPGKDAKTQIERLVLDGSLSGQIRTFARQHQITVYMFLLGAFNMLLYRCTQKQTIAVLGNFANRGRKEIENVFGWFANTHPIGVRVDPEMTVTELLAEIRDTVLGIEAHQETPLPMVWGSMAPDPSSEAPMRDDAVRYIGFDFLNAKAAIPRQMSAGLKTSFLAPETQISDLALGITAVDDSILITLQALYSSNKFSPSAICRLCSEFKEVIEQIIARPDLEISSSLSMLAMQTEARESFFAGFSPVPQTSEKSDQ